MPIREPVKTPSRNQSGVALLQLSDICLQCGTPELRCQPPSFVRRLFSLVVYNCGRCDYRETRFRFSIFTVIVPIVVGLLIVGTVYMVRYTTFAGAEEKPLATTPDALARARASSGGLSAYEMMMLKRPRTTLDNATVLKLWRAEVGSDVILQMIRTSNADYDLSANAVIQLKQAGVDRIVILAMIDASYNAR
jgi:hypothetical protein